jgi:hypothetical protein
MMLVLKRETFFVRTPFRTWTRRWNEVSEFEVMSERRLFKQRPKWVGFDELGDGTPRLLRHVNDALVGCDAVLPDNYGLDYEELATLMNVWRDAALEREEEVRMRGVEPPRDFTPTRT